MAYKTPGVYIVEQNAFPNSVVEVATAIPAFVGHTARAINKGNKLLNKPWRITSLSEYAEYFGGAPTSLFTLEESVATAGVGGAPDVKAPPVDFSIPKPGATPPDTEYSLSRADTPYLLYASMQLFFQNGGGPCYIVSIGDYRTGFSSKVFMDGIDQLKKEMEPTMLVIPEAVQLEEPECIKVQQAMLQHCGVDMKNRFAILDVHNGNNDRSHSDPVAAFRDHLGTNSLKFAAAYYPWLDTAILSDSDVSYRNVDDSKDLLLTLLTADLKITGDAPTLPIPKKNFEEKQGALAAMKDIWFVAKLDDNGKLVPLNANEFGPAQHQDDKAKLKNYGELKTALESAKPGADLSLMLTAEQLDAALVLIDKARLAVHQLLIKASPLYSTLLHIMACKLNQLPPSAAIAGLYTSVDNARGVWKAPANVSLNAVIAPSVNINHEEQEDLNVTTGGKSINAIRAFIGAGVLVWGARTLDGNSLDWRYVNVRRTMIMIEESLRLAMAAYVFEPNTANTWVTVKGMANNFLTNIWKRGGLAGASAEDAFSVQVGLGATMTAEDILEGTMKVKIMLALSRPAEFIELTFQQQMQKS